ncbi:histone-like nucleoid-structuring protein Lsr2 [Pseudonocardia spinosispora]|uniref:histone-like nucleoid-structuring protein Lsr2 n=1 Tax=Pseudonocardia spinosispora TaxID=103441 RepID=UPI00048F1343|nr:Lsr2 family protein [Pseudonocardia spinosispora]
MSQKVQVQLVDDLDGDPADETVRFSLDGRDYEIDLTARHALALRENLADYIDAGRKAGTGVKAASRPDRERVRAVREWGKANGFELADRGRVPAEVWTAYEKAS